MHWNHALLTIAKIKKYSELLQSNFPDYTVNFHFDFFDFPYVMKPKTNNKGGVAVPKEDPSLQQFRDFVYSRQVRSESVVKGKAKSQESRQHLPGEPDKKLVYEVQPEKKTTTFFVAEDRGDKLFQLSQKEIRTAKQVVEESFRPTHSIDGHAGTIVNSGGYRLDLQGYINNCGTKWANVQLQYGMRKAGTSNTYAQVLIPTEDPVDYSHDVRLKAINLSLQYRVAVWVRTVPATPEELKAPVRDDFSADQNAKVSQKPKK